MCAYVSGCWFLVDEVVQRSISTSLRTCSTIHFGYPLKVIKTYWRWLSLDLIVLSWSTWHELLKLMFEECLVSMYLVQMIPSVKNLIFQEIELSCLKKFIKLFEISAPKKLNKTPLITSLSLLLGTLKKLKMHFQNCFLKTVFFKNINFISLIYSSSDFIRRIRKMRAESKLITAKQVWFEPTLGIFLSKKSVTSSP